MIRPAIPLLAAMLAAAPFAAPAETPVRVLATIGQIGDLAAEIAGDCAEVEWMMGEGVDPHLYRATPADVRALDRADLVLYLGLGLEGQLADVLDRFADRKPVSAVGGAAFDPAELIREDGAIDPHLWMAPALWARIVPPLADVLAEAAPGCAGIAANAATLAGQLAALDRWAADSIATIPEERRILVTAHDAFEYFGRAYGLELVAIQGLSTESEASVADIADTARLVAEAGVPAVFVESTINPRTVEAMIAAARDRGHEVGIGGELYSDAMGTAGTPEGTYIGMIRANILTITGALGGTPPPLPEDLAPWAARHGLD